MHCEKSNCQGCYSPESFNVMKFANAAYKKNDSAQKRRRKLSKEVDRYFHCDYPGCYKSYGTVSHLNTHRKQKQHGQPLLKRYLETNVENLVKIVQ